MNRVACASLLAAGVLIAGALPVWGEEAAAPLAEAKKDTDGFLSHAVPEKDQDAMTQIMVLLPDKLEKSRRYPVLYVLQGSSDSGEFFGHPLREIKKHDLHNKLGLICVMPLRARENWYTVAVKPTPADLRGEKYLMDVVLPFVEEQYPAEPEANSRLLLGFSLSGVVAFSMVFRHPDVFGRAAAFDAPLDAPGFLQYLADDARVKAVTKETRLILIGYDVYRDYNKQVHEKLERLQVPHVYEDGPLRKHRWDSGWVEQAVRLLVSSKLDRKSNE